MNLRNVFTVYLKELKDSLRDRRTLLSIIIIPTLVMPLMTFGFGVVASKVIGKARQEVPTVVIVGGEDSPKVVGELKASKKFTIVERGDDTEEQIKAKIADKKLRAAIKLPDKFEENLGAGVMPTVTIYHYDGEMKSSFGASGLEQFLRELQEKMVIERLAEKSLPANLVKPFAFKRQNVAPPEKVGGNTFGGFVPYLIIILCFTGAMYPAIDLTAGEKERGTMETLLCSPVARGDIVLGKFLMVLTGSLSAMGCMLVSMGTTALIAGAWMAGGGAKGVPAAAPAKNAIATLIPVIDPLGLAGVLAMVLPVAVLFAAVTFALALFAKSHKEAQSYLAPLLIVVIMPAAIGLLPGIELNAALAFVPLLNLSLVCREMLSGVWHWNYIAIIFGSSCVYAALALGLAVRMFKREDVIFRT